MDRRIVPMVYSAEFVALLAENGVAPSDVLRGTGISRRKLRDPDELISHGQQLRVYQNALALSCEPGLGFRLGARLGLDHHSVLGHAVLYAENVRELLRMLLRYTPIRGFLLDFHFREEGGVAVLGARDIMPLGAVHQVAVEEMLAMLAGSSQGLSRVVWPTEVRVDYPAPAHSSQYEEVCGCPVRFSCDTVELRIPSATLDAPMEMSNAEMASICEERCRAILERLGSGGQMADRVRSHLVAAPLGFQLETVAKQMAMTPRTLSRRLWEEGTTFRDVVGDVRKGLALDYLETSDLALEEIAGLLGYMDSANFNRAFRKWVDESPGRYRRRVRGERAS